MHPAMTEKLAADRISDMVAWADAAQRAQDARRARHDQQARGRRATAGRGAGQPAADWASRPVISVRGADGTGR